MNRNFIRYAAILAAAAVAQIASPATAEELPSSPGVAPPAGSQGQAPEWNRGQAVPAFAEIQHRPIRPHLDERGHAKRNVKNSLLTNNWSGYAVANFETGLTYGSASATWQVPQVTWGSTNGNPYGYEYNSIWVGIGGFCENSSCSVIDQQLIQLGTEQLVSGSGTVLNYVWYELYPAVSQQISETVQPGDIITASLECTANCVPNQQQTWHLTMTDQTRGWTWSQDFNFTTTMLSAEWIAEAPYYNGVLPLNNFVQANFDPAVANGVSPNLSLTTNSIVMQDPYGQTSNPSDVVNGNWFGACYGYSSLTPCTAGGFTSGTSTTTTTSSSGGGSTTTKPSRSCKGKKC